MAAFGAALPCEVRVVIVTGEGPSFSAGLDRRMFTPAGVPGERSLMGLADLTDDDAAAVIHRYQAGFEWLRRTDIISVAAVRGHAVGAGFQLALACDLRLATPDAQFTMAEPTLGLVPDLGGTQPLVAAIGYSRAVEICATGRRLGAVEAERLGLVNLIVGDDELAAATQGVAAALLSSNRDAVAATKDLLLGAATRSYDEQLLAERVAQVARIRALVTDLSEAKRT
jgi:enoyl-CoA hydratase/carnithine racemase